MKIRALMTIHQMIKDGSTIEETAAATGTTAAEIRSLLRDRSAEDDLSGDVRLETAAWNRERAASARAAL